MTSQKSRAEARERVRDRMWLWSHHPGVYDGMFGLPRNSRITPVDAARYLGTPNIMFIRASGQPAYPFEAYAAAFKDVKRLQWSITGSAGATSREEREHALQLAASMPNITGLYMDDFFNFARQGQEASMTVDEVKAIRDRMTIDGRRLELGIVVYTADQFDDRMRPYLELCDAISLVVVCNRTRRARSQFRPIAGDRARQTSADGVLHVGLRAAPTHAARAHRTPMRARPPMAPGEAHPRHDLLRRPSLRPGP